MSRMRRCRSASYAIINQQSKKTTVPIVFLNFLNQVNFAPSWKVTSRIRGPNQCWIKNLNNILKISRKKKFDIFFQFTKKVNFDCLKGETLILKSKSELNEKFEASFEISEYKTLYFSTWDF